MEDSLQPELDMFKQLLGDSFVEKGDGKWRALCPFSYHTGDHLPFSIYQGRDDGRLLWRCDKCKPKPGVGVHQLAAELGREEVVQALPANNGRPQTASDPFELMQTACARLLGDQEALECLQQDRCINRETVEKMRLGIDSDGFYLFPAFGVQGALISIRRHLWRGKARWKISHGGHELFGLDAIAEARESGEPLLLCEGEPDAAAVRSAGFLSVGVPQPKAWKQEWCRLLMGIEVVICFSNTPDGEKGATGIAGEIYEYARTVRIVRWPGNRKHAHNLTTEIRERTPRCIKGLISRARQYLPDMNVNASPSIIDWTKTPHVRIPFAVCDHSSLNYIDISVYGAIQRRIGRENKWTPMAHATLASNVRCSREYVVQSISRLERAGFVLVRRPPSYKREANSYRLVVVS